MSKNTATAQFRKVDVDQLDEDRYQDEQIDETGESGPNESDIQSLLMAKKNNDALKAVLASPVFSSKNQSLKNKSLELVIKVLSAFKTNEADTALKTLEKNEIEILMKYIYRGFAEPSDSYSAVLLTWHERVLKVGGLGCIVRVLTDKKSV